MCRESGLHAEISGIQRLTLLQTVNFFGLFVLSISPRLHRLSLCWFPPQVCLMRVYTVILIKVALHLQASGREPAQLCADQHDMTHISVTPAGMIVWTLLLQIHCSINQVFIQSLSKAISQPPSNAMHMHRHPLSNSKCTGTYSPMKVMRHMQCVQCIKHKGMHIITHKSRCPLMG